MVTVSNRYSVSALGRPAQSFADATRAVDYTVSKEKVYDRDGKALDGMRGIFNAKTRQPFAVMGEGYTFYQPSESLEIMRAAVETVPGATWRSVFVAQGGAQICAFADLPGTIVAPKRGDRVALSLSFRDYFNGKGITSFSLDGLVLACTNGMTTAESIFAIGGKHTLNLKDKVERARLTLAMRIQDETEALRGFVHRLDSTPMTRGEMEAFSLRLFNVESERALDEAPAQTRAKVETVRELFVRGAGNVGQTRWDAYNAVTESTDWFGNFRASEAASATENRALSLMGGTVAKVKQRAAELLLA